MARWGRIGSRGNVEDRRGIGPVGIGGLGTIGVLLLLAINLFGGGSVDVNDVLSQLNNLQGTSQIQVQPEEFRGEDDYEVFASRVLGSNNDVWAPIFSENNQAYQEPRLVLFRDVTQSACGIASSQVGPHYCPRDNTIYLDETFFEELERRFGAEGGDVAEAYVIAHEVGHHVQNELGIMAEVQSSQQYNRDSANELSIKLELQADCFAGVWAHSVAELGVFEQGEIEEAIDAAEAVGDDRIQENTTGEINPETWTHGSSEQRVEWFNRGLESGQPSSCNTFS